jgi:RNA-directed DNA polymerase
LKPESVSTKQERIAKLAAENPAMAFTSLNHYLDAEWLRYAYECTRKDGVDLPRFSGQVVLLLNDRI